MRVAVLGGTGFIGFALVEELVGAGHSVTVVHRGNTEPPDLPEVEHVHAERSALPPLQGFDAIVDNFAMSRGDAEAGLRAAGNAHLVVTSSMDVYRAFGSLRGGQETDPLPLDEESPVRESRYPYPDAQPNYDKLDVEDIYAPGGACVLRLPMVYGERDKLRRQEFVLRRIRAGRRRMPIGEGGWLTCRGYVRDVARAMRMAMEGRLAGEVLANLRASVAWHLSNPPPDASTDFSADDTALISARNDAQA